MLATSRSNTVNSAVIGWLTIIILFVGGAWGYLMPATLDLSGVPGDLGDARFNSVILEHVYQWLTGKVPSLWSPSFFYPFENVLVFSDNHFGSILPYATFRILGATREVAFDGWFITGYVLNFFASVYTARRLGFGYAAAGAAAFAFTYALPALAQDGHAQLTYRFATPLAYMFLLGGLALPRAKNVALFLFFFAWQFYCSIYLGIFLGFLTAATILAYKVRPHSGGLIRAVLRDFFSKGPGKRVSILALGLASLCSIAWLLYMYKSGSAPYHLGRSWDEISSMLPRLGSYLLSDRSPVSAWIGSWVSGIPMRHEHQMFPGIAVIVLALCGLLAGLQSARWREMTILVTLALLAVILTTLNVSGYSLYALVTKIPGVGAIRAVSRIILIMLLPLSLLVALGVHELETKLSGQRLFHALILVVLLPAALIFEVSRFSVSAQSSDTWRTRVMTTLSLLSGPIQKDSILFVRSRNGEPFFLAELDGMIVAQDKGIPTLNGYSGSVTPGYVPPDPCLPVGIRLAPYADFHRLPVSSMTHISRHVVTADGVPCQYSGYVSTSSKVPADVVKGIGVQIKSVKMDYGRFHVQAVILNRTSKYFVMVPGSNNPISLSWRRVADSLSDEGVAKGLGWDPRVALSGTIAPGDSQQIEFWVPDSPASGNRLEISLVQDGIQWFHNVGMPLAHMELP